VPARDTSGTRIAQPTRYEGTVFVERLLRGHRIWVSLILDLLASGMKVEGILAEYPQVAAEDVQAWLAYASEMTREPTVHIV
jgi:uncharacterized protein (DUF433 family)